MRMGEKCSGMRGVRRRAKGCGVIERKLHESDLKSFDHTHQNGLILMPNRIEQKKPVCLLQLDCLGIGRSFASDLHLCLKHRIEKEQPTVQRQLEYLISGRPYTPGLTLACASQDCAQEIFCDATA